ncbi:MAG: radical SAM protein [Desulfobacteraceae bacterium]|nr:MAG: radical SAM protein [Desulfobacteraceae bacterium]
MKTSLILINPWIYDFAAYDLWSKPLGLLYLAGYLRCCGFKIHLIDCLNVHHPGMKGDKSMKTPTRRSYGTGKYWRQEVPKPLPLKVIPRPYSRYGLSLKTFAEELNKIRKPAAILVTSLMTYWYPGVKEVISLAKKVHPNVPIILGGIYARLCHDHASQNMLADRIVIESDPVSLLEVLSEFGIPTPGIPPDSVLPPYPAFELLSQIDYVCLLTSRGCPYQCRYCASHFLDPQPTRRDPGEVLEEIVFWYKEYKVRDFAYYDDALLFAPEKYFALLLENLARQNLGLRFHTPNAVHVKEITAHVASLMHQTGFRTIRLGLETSDFSLHRDLDNKISEGDFERGVQNLLRAGFAHNEIGAYILMGLPGQSVDSVMKTIDFVANTGAIPLLAEYSPIPHTSLWKRAISHSEYDLTSEPLFHNNSLLPCWHDSQKKELPRLKRRVLEIRKKYK